MIYLDFLKSRHDSYKGAILVIFNVCSCFILWTLKNAEIILQVYLSNISNILWIDDIQWNWAYVNAKKLHC